jgi:hypothetical protein
MPFTAAPINRFSFSGDKSMARFSVVILLLVLSASRLRAEEDPAVTRAREIARQQYELEKARREAAAIANTRQGVVTLYNPDNSHVIFNCRWKMWDGSYSAWLAQDIKDKRSLCYSKQGGVKFEIMFNSPGGGEKRYLVASSKAPNDVKPTADDGKPQHFMWGKNTDLDLFSGKPKD